jgi:hypothetical protein
MAYFEPHRAGIKSADTVGDGTSIKLTWFRAYPSSTSGAVAYQIYYSTKKELVYHEGVKAVYTGSQEGADLSTTLLDFTPGESYWFAVRALEYPVYFDPFVNFRQIAPNTYTYPSSPLRSAISATDLLIPLVDVSEFPDAGLILIGSELINYTSVDRTNQDLILSDASDRGYNNTIARQHTPDGFDGRLTWIYRNVAQIYVYGELKDCDVEYYCNSRFEYPTDQYLLNKGYHQKTEDIANTDLTASDEKNVDFPMYDYAGWHRVDPVLQASGVCTGSYSGGEMYCADDENGVGRVVRGVSWQDRMNQREEMLLRMTGVPCVLLKRQQTGIRCSCYLSTHMHPDKRCPKCYGTGFVLGYAQYFNERESDGRIMVRFSPMEDEVKLTDVGFDVETSVDAQTLTIPTLHGRDVLIRYSKVDNNEEFRYEVISVTRNNTFLGDQGAQKMKLGRIRRTDTIYKVLAFADTSKYPSWLVTEPSLNNGKIATHTHQIRRNESFAYAWQQNTTVDSGHQHQVLWVNNRLTVLPVLDHTHDLVVPI